MDTTAFLLLDFFFFSLLLLFFFLLSLNKLNFIISVIYLGKSFYITFPKLKCKSNSVIITTYRSRDCVALMTMFSSYDILYILDLISVRIVYRLNTPCEFILYSTTIPLFISAKQISICRVRNNIVLRSNN